MKYLFIIVITIFICSEVWAQCPANNYTSVEVRTDEFGSKVIVKFDQEYDNIKEINVIKFGSGIVENAVIRKRNKKEFFIEGLESGEYMIQIVGNDCTSYVGTDKDYQGFIIK